MRLHVLNNSIIPVVIVVGPQTIQPRQQQYKQYFPLNMINVVVISVDDDVIVDDVAVMLVTLCYLLYNCTIIFIIITPLCSHLKLSSQV